MRYLVRALFGGVLVLWLAAGLLPPAVVAAAVGQIPSGQSPDGGDWALLLRKE